MLRRLATLLLLASAAGVDHGKFRTCSQTGFCRRRRTARPERAYVVAPGSLAAAGNAVRGELHGGPFGVKLALELSAFSAGVVRLRITESSPLHGARWEPSDILSEDLEPVALKPVGAADLGASHPLRAALESGSAAAYAFGAASRLAPASGRPVRLDETVLAVHLHPFKAELYQWGVRTLALNEGGRFYFEHHRRRDDAAVALPAEPEGDVHGGKTVVDYGEDGLAIYADGTKQQRAVDAAADAAAAAPSGGGDEWEESFGSHRDSKPFGPSSVGVDITFERIAHVYGLAEHATDLNLPSTTGGAAPGSSKVYSEPYRMYTLDVYDYELDSPMAIYGGVPLLIGHNAETTAAALWFNPSETFVDISRGKTASGADGTTSYWMSESGVVDVMLLPGPAPEQIFAQYAALTGVTPLPPLFALGYHQCRWNYNDEADVRYVHGQFEALDLPYDVLWLDIEHTDGKRYFTWDAHKFPHPKEMQLELAATGRKMVTIVDPHIKKDSGYAVYQEAHDKKLFIQKKDGAELDGWCWPGSSAYLDFTSAEVRQWWAERFAYDKYEGSTEHLYTWNDMNEPSVFNGPEVSMDKDAKSLAGVEHREWHNLYGMYMQQATWEGLLQRNEGRDRRPFVLSRSFYAGSQRWGAIWTGDNACKWTHLEAAMPMLLSMGLCGITFAGADVGGFLGKGGGYGDPDAELFTRWFQAGAYQPFFRGHAHHESARREPWTWDDATTARLREVAKQRYQLLAYWYTAFRHAEVTGMPTMRPLWVAYPKDAATFEMSREFLAGPDLLVHPIAHKGATSASVYFPGVEGWYDVVDGTAYAGGREVRVAAPIDKLPVFQRGGSVVPRQMTLRRASALMKDDAYTLVVAPDAAGGARGGLYLDGGDGYSYRDGAYAQREYVYATAADGARTLRSIALHANSSFAPPNLLERVELLGLGGWRPATATLTAADGTTTALAFSYSAERQRLVVRKPAVEVAADWSIELK